ncbi:ComF family protein [Sphingomonas sp.]|jgi:ComF family protein|uniref:ComF family protein n=1 Tax=Sphingomonas sp. TaxID=28214 RepID=UPI00262D5DB9|nr:ComF family protein [Sphingomonas sp.]
MLAKLLQPVISLALPPRCAGCGAIADDDHRFCATCWGSLRFLGPPWCAACHAPMSYEPAPGTWCAPCLQTPPRHGGIDAAVAYGEVARGVALRLKYGGRAAFAETAARLMARHLATDVDLLVPVPLHRWRLWSRGYNQAGLIATALARLSGVRVDAQALVRHRATQPLRGASGAERRRVVRGAFAVPPGARARVTGKRIVLIDDVYTSGATTDACITTLRSAGAAHVAVLCWARVISDRDD